MSESLKDKLYSGSAWPPCEACGAVENSTCLSPPLHPRSEACKVSDVDHVHGQAFAKPEGKYHRKQTNPESVFLQLWHEVSGE